MNARVVDFNSYFIIDDCIDQRGTEGFVVMYGDPYTAVGTEQFKSRLLRECTSFCSKRLTPRENIYRVRLARRHGEHKVTILAVPKNQHWR